MSQNITFESLTKTIQSRRTSKEFSGQELNREIIEKLLELVVWAPNHRLNEPWRFRVLLQKALPSWLHHLEKKLEAAEWNSLAQARDRVQRAGALIFVCSIKSDQDEVTQENYAATCAGIQNLLLGATSLGLASYWSTARLMTHPQTFSYLKIPESEKFVGALWLGEGKIPDAKARKSAKEFTEWIPA